MDSLKGTQTERNLVSAFAGESQACLRYAFFAKKAKKEGLELISGVFERTSEEERAHASMFYKLLQGGEVTVECTFPAGGNGTTAENLEAAINGEHDEWETVYPAYAKTAEAEGFPHIARIFLAVAKAEEYHESRHLGLLAHLQNGTLFKREETVVWRCRKCGYLHEGPEPPDACPACAHPKAYFEVLRESW